MKFRYGQWVRFKRGERGDTKRRYKTACASRIITTVDGRKVEVVRLHCSNTGYYYASNLEACL